MSGKNPIARTYLGIVEQKLAAGGGGNPQPATTPYGTERSNRAAVAWDALTAAQKVAALREVIEAAVQRAVPPVLPAR